MTQRPHRGDQLALRRMERACMDYRDEMRQVYVGPWNQARADQLARRREDIHNKLLAIVRRAYNEGLQDGARTKP